MAERHPVQAFIGDRVADVAVAILWLVLTPTLVIARSFDYGTKKFPNRKEGSPRKVIRLRNEKVP